MKLYRLLAPLMIVLLCLTSGLVFAQVAVPEAPPEATPVIPSQPLMPCPTQVSATTVCDMIATKAADMVGVWAVYFLGVPQFVRFNADGTWVYGHTAESTSVATTDYPSGTSSFDADGNWVTLFTPLPTCQSARYRVRVIMVGGQPVALNLGPVDDCFVLRASDYGYTLLRVSGS